MHPSLHLIFCLIYVVRLTGNYKPTGTKVWQSMPGPCMHMQRKQKK